MRKFILYLVCFTVLGCASTDNRVRFSGPSSEYIEPKGNEISYLHLETEKKTDGFGLPPYPHTALVYELCSNEENKQTFGYVGDIKIATRLKYGNPAIVKVNSGQPIFLAFGLIHSMNGYECTSKYIFTPENSKTYSFINSVNWSECPTKTGVISSKKKIIPIQNLQTLNKATISELQQKGININRERCKT